MLNNVFNAVNCGISMISVLLVLNGLELTPFLF